MADYTESEDLRERARFLAEKHNLSWLDFDRIHFYTYFSNTRTAAKCAGFSKVLQLPKEHIMPYYVIVFNTKHFNEKMSEQEKDNTIIHELLHIAKKFSGEFSSVSHRNIYKLADTLSKK